MFKQFSCKTNLNVVTHSYKTNIILSSMLYWILIQLLNMLLIQYFGWWKLLKFLSKCQSWKVKFYWIFSKGCLNWKGTTVFPDFLVLDVWWEVFFAPQGRNLKSVSFHLGASWVFLVAKIVFKIGTKIWRGNKLLLGNTLLGS